MEIASREKMLFISILVGLLLLFVGIMTDMSMVLIVLGILAIIFGLLHYKFGNPFEEFIYNKK